MLLPSRQGRSTMLLEKSRPQHPASWLLRRSECLSSVLPGKRNFTTGHKQTSSRTLTALPAFNEAAELAAGGHVDVATAEGLLKSIPTDPDAVWTHLQHHSIGLSSVAGFFDTLSTSLQGHPMPHDSLPLASMNLDFLQLDGDYTTPDLAFSEVYMTPADLHTYAEAASHVHNGIAISAVADQSSSLLDSAAATSDPTSLPAILQGLPDAASWATTASVGEAVANLTDVAQSSPASAYLNDLAVWAAEKLSVIQLVDPTAFEDIRCSMAQLVETLQKTINLEAEREAQNYTNAIVLSLQQIAAAIALPVPGGVSSIGGMAAAQEAVATTSSMIRLEELMKIALGVIAMIIAAIPRDKPTAGEDAEADDPNDTIPLRYDPDGLADYFSRRPVLVMQRNAVVVGKMTGLLTNLLLDWQLGKISENMPLRAKQLRVAAEQLGPAYIKIAQAMSTRVDMVPETYLVEFAKLQDNVPPFGTAEARLVLENGLGRPVDQIFEWLSEEPLAAASLGQVYRGKLRESYGGCEVAVKVQRPNVLESVSLDIFIMRRAAAIFSKLPGMNDQWEHVLDDWAMRFFMEMDYQLEAEHTTTFRLQMEERNLKAIKVAEVHPDLVARKVIVTEWLQGEKLSESSADDIRALCSTLLNCYLIQLLETGFLHADPHPGNLLRTPDGHIAILDFGLMTEVTEEQRVLLVEFIAHLTLNDWEAISHDLEGFGFFPDGLPEEIRPQVLPILEHVMSILVQGGGLSKGFSISGITQQLDNVARNFQMVVPPYFGLILRAFSTIEGIALRVDPKYAIVQECLPYLSQRLFTDTNPRMKAALRQMLYGDKKRVDIARLQKLFTAVGNFATAPQPQAMGPTISAMYGERVKGQAPPPEREEPMINDGVKEALRVVFSSKGSFVQELVVEEMVATVDAMSKEALGEALRMALGSASAVAALRSMESLGPLRMMLMPVPLPMEYLSSMQPRVQLNEEDRQALLLFRTVLDLLQPAVTGMPFAAANGRQAVRVAGELVPLMPELLPGIQHTAEMFMKAMMRRVALRIADDLDPSRPEPKSRQASAQFQSQQQQQYQGIPAQRQAKQTFRSPSGSHHHQHHHHHQNSNPAPTDTFRRY